MHKINNFFPGSNTIMGFYSFYHYLAADIDNNVIIKGGPGTGKSTLMKKIGEEFLQKKYHIEFHWCSSDVNSLDGVVIPEKNFAIFDGTAPHTNDPSYPGVVEEIFNPGRFWNQKVLKKSKNEIIQLNNEISQNFASAYNFLKIAGILMQEAEKNYERSYQEKISNYIINYIISNIATLTGNKVSNSKERHLFASAVTPQGFVACQHNLINKKDFCYILKGKPEREKSRIIKTIATFARNSGYDIFLLHSGLSPDNIDLLYIHELKIAVINDTRPYDITNFTGKTLNLMAEVKINKKIIEEHNYFLNKATSFIKKAKEKHDQLESYYIEAMDFPELEKESQLLIAKYL